MSDLSVGFFPKGETLPAGMSRMFDDAEGALGRLKDSQKKKVMKEKIDKARQGVFDLIVISSGRDPVGFVSVKSMGGDSDMTFGHVDHAFDDRAETVFRMIIDTLAVRGARTIISIFNWTEPGAFARAAEAVGFSRVDRIDMSRDCKTSLDHGRRPDGIEIVPWSPAYFDDVNTLLFENIYPEDLIITPQARTLEGCRTCLRNIIDHHYGELLPGLSFVALRESRPVGVLLSSARSDDALIVELAVDRAFRGRGIATAMIGRLVDGGSAAGKGQVILTVTASNRIALELYEKMGFVTGAAVSYYIYSPEQ